MIYLFAGDDFKKRIDAYEKFLKTVPNSTEKFFISKNDLLNLNLENFYASSSLFFKQSAIILTEILTKEDTKLLVLDKLQQMSESKNLFIFSESKLNKPTVDLFKKYKAVLNVFDLPKAKLEKFNNFLLAYDFEKRDKLNLWIHYRQAVDLGVGLDELSGVLFWKAKDMILKNNFRNFSKEQLRDFIQKISYLLPKARGEGKDAEVVFEKFILLIK